MTHEGGKGSREEYAARVEAFIQERFAPEDAHLRRIRKTMEEQGLPAIQLPASTARVVQLLVRAVGARRVLEIGTLAGYSALWIARALPEGGRLVTVDRDPERVRLALELLRASGMAERVEGRVGDAGEVLEAMEETWDVLLLDADKEGLPRYVEHARRLVAPGGLLLVDNALWRGRVVDPEADDEATGAIRSALSAVAADPAFDATLIPVGDGLLVGLRLPDPPVASGD